MLHLVSSLVLVAGLATPPDSAELRREELMSILRNGGYTVFLRHARTDRSFNEVRDYVPKERSAQRNLTDEGIRDAALMGVVFRKYGVAFGEILASPMARTAETAEYAAGRPVTTMALRVFPATPEQAAIVMTPPKAGTNRLVVTHHFVLETHIPGVSPGYIGESEAAVVRHTADGKVELIGRITLDDWRMLANPGQPAPAATPPAAAPAHGAPAGTPANEAPLTGSVPDTHAGHIAREYIGAFNTGNPEKMRGFLDSYMIADPARPTSDRLKFYAKLFDDHGPIAIETVHSSESTQIVLGARSKRGAFRLTVKSSETEPMRATSVSFAMMEGAHR